MAWTWLKTIRQSDEISPNANPNAVPRRWHGLTRRLLDPYRPELYYMRGPGPKWHEKHDQAEPGDRSLGTRELLWAEAEALGRHGPAH